MEDKRLNEKESLELIMSMIRNTQHNAEAGGRNIFLVWGYVTAVISLIIYGLIWGEQYWAHWLWFLIPVIGYPVMYAYFRKKPTHVVTYIDKVTTYIWAVTGGVIVLLPFVYTFWDSTLPIFFLICLLLSIAITFTGLVIKFNPVFVGGLIGILLSFGFLLPLGKNLILLFALMAIVTMIVPGHLLNRSLKKEIEN